jgi:hypothetical protein
MARLRIAVAALAVTGCSLTAALIPSTTQAAVARTTAPGWYGYHGGGTNSGYSASMPAAGALHLVKQRGLDGAVYGSPIAARGIIIAATENDSVYGLSTAGRVLWRAHLGTPAVASQLPCGDISPLGITGSPVYSPSSGLVYMVAETGSNGIGHTMFALDAATGRVAWHRSVDLSGVDVTAMQQRGALTITGNRVWVTFGGLAGDCGNYKGRLIGVPLYGRGTAAVYTVPTAREGGMWQPSGPAVGQAGTLLVAVGNGASVSGAYDHSDSLLQLNTQAGLLQYFAPRGWANENANDTDLGSIGPAVIGKSWLVQGGKSGRVYVLRPGHLGGIGGQVSSLVIAPSFGGSAVAGGVVYLPCVDGIRALRVDSSGHLHVLWTSGSTINGSPVVGGQRVWSLDGQAGRLYGLSLATGRSLGSIAVGTTNRFATPALYGDLVIVPTLAGISIVRE